MNRLRTGGVQSRVSGKQDSGHSQSELHLKNIDPRKFTVLIVDAQRNTQVIHILNEAGFNTVEANSTQLALLYFDQMQPDLVLMRLLLPDLDQGAGLCRQIRTQRQNGAVPILVLSDENSTEVISQAFDAGATDVIISPVNPLLLVKRTQYLIRANRTLRSLEDRERVLEQAERIASLGSWEWNNKSNTLIVSREFNRILGLEEEAQPTIFDILDMMPEAEKSKLVKHFRQKDSKHQGTITLNHKLQTETGITRILRHEAQFKLLNDVDYSIFGTIHDITDEVVHKDQILHLAYYDSLTQLPNRTFYKTHLEFAIQHARRNNGLLAVVVFDLDLFTRINNSLGHEAGDELLKQVADRLQRTYSDTECTKLNMSAIDPQAPAERMTDKLARLEGDQFALMVYNFDGLDSVILSAQRIMRQVSTPFLLRGNSIVLTASAGIALYPVNGQNAETLLRNADAAMHFAKSQGRNSFHFYSSDIDFKSRERLSMESDLRQAIRLDELQLYFQPKVHLKSGTIRSVEALVRWQHPTRGEISPAEFVSMAEEIGLINDLGIWLINRACRQAKQWNEEGLPPIRVAINLSPVQIRTGMVVGNIKSALQKHGIPPSQLEVEITETVLLEDTQRVMRTLEGIRRLGVRVALDDFGTGYSSLSYLTRFPFNTLKIDRSFVSRCARHPQSAAIIHTIIQLCKNLNLEVVAEGVETEKELQFLIDHRCDYIQGYYFSEALSAEDLSHYIKRQSWSQLLGRLN